MADAPEISLLGLLDTELQELLEKDYNTPSPKWHAGLRVQLEILQSCLETKTPYSPESPDTSDTPDSSHSDIDVSATIVSPSIANAAALPVIKLMSHNMLIANNEYLACTAFGTVSPESFRAIFWEMVDQRSDIKVYEDYPSPRFQFGDYRFSLDYYHWPDLVRLRPKILNAETSFLDSRKNQPEYLSVLKIQGYQERYNQLSLKYGTSVVQSTFYYLRAWSIERGILHHPRLGTGVWTADHILKMIAVSTLNDEPSSDPEHQIRRLVGKVIKAILQSLVPEIDLRLLGTEPRPESQFTDLLPKLELVKDLPLRDKLDMPFYLKIDLVINESSITQGQWFRTVEESMPGFRKLLSKELVASRGTYRVWPSQLLLGSHPQELDLSESCYVIGLCFPDNEQLRAKITAEAEKWIDNVTKRGNEDIKRPCYVTVKLLDYSHFGDDVYSNVTRQLRQDIITGPSGKARKKAIQGEGPQKSSEKKGSKKKKQENTSSTGTAGEPTNKLKEVSAILNRLRSDSSFDIDDFRVGYLDRFKKDIQEKPAASWQTEKTHDEFIPESRIEYVKKCAEGEEPLIMWHKKEKIDLFSYTGNSTRE